MPKQIKITDDGDQMRAGIAKMPWLRLALLLLVCFGVVFPFTKTGKDVVSVLKRKQFAEGKKSGQNTVKKNTAADEKLKQYEKQLAASKQELFQAKVDADKKIKDLTNKVNEKKRLPVVGIDKGHDLRKTTRGFNLKYKADFSDGDLATKERVKDDSYVADFVLKVKVPKAATTMAELNESNPHLARMLPGLGSLVKDAKVSPFYKTLYENKKKRLRTKLLSLGDTLTMHNFYDCETMLEMKHPVNKRRVFLFQADMDVVTDGSDGDRLSEMPDEVIKSTYYQPFTSYGWNKVTDTPNPMIAGWEQRIINAKQELAKSSTSSDRKSWLRSRMKDLRIGIDDMKKRSFLIAEHDPFIVIAVNQLTANRSLKDVPRIGDYVAVVHGNKIYPAIVGDGGPTFKAGEASLRLAKTLNPKASSYHRPVSDLAVTYIVFPGSAPKQKAAPDYELWHQACSKLLDEIGGLGSGYELHQWENTLLKEEPEIIEAAETVEEPNNTEKGKKTEKGKIFPEDVLTPVER